MPFLLLKFDVSTLNTTIYEGMIYDLCIYARLYQQFNTPVRVPHHPELFLVTRYFLLFHNIKLKNTTHNLHHRNYTPSNHMLYRISHC